MYDCKTSARNIFSALIKCKSEQVVASEFIHWGTVEDNDSNSCMNQFLVILKPEICEIGEGIKTEEIIWHTLKTFSENGISVNAAHVFNDKYIRLHSIVENQYSILNIGSRLGLSHMSHIYQNRVKKLYGDHIIVGAYDFLQRFTFFTAESLEKIAHEVGSIKLGNGTYLLSIEQEGVKYGVINAFHPRQVEHFRREQNSMVVLECTSNTDYKVICEKIIGNFNPQDASEGSLRNYLFKNEKNLGLNKISILLNGFHISPSPLEGLFGILRYRNMNNPLKLFGLQDTLLSKKMLESGLAEQFIYNLRNNLIINSGKEIAMLFDYMEGKNSDQILLDVLSIAKNITNSLSPCEELR